MPKFLSPKLDICKAKHKKYRKLTVKSTKLLETKCLFRMPNQHEKNARKKYKHSQYNRLIAFIYNFTNKLYATRKQIFL